MQLIFSIQCVFSQFTAQRSLLVHRAPQNSNFLFFSVGKSKTEVVNSCRQAIKNNNFDLLVKVIGLGKVSETPPTSAGDKSSN